MNQHQPVLSQVPPAIPYQHARPGQHVPFTPPPYPPHPHAYQSYPNAYFNVQYQRPPPQWQPYPMHMPMGRPYPQYPPMSPYPGQQQHYPQMRPSPHQQPSSSSIHSAHGMLSPPPTAPAFYPPPNAPLQQVNPRLAPPTPPPPPPVRTPTPTRSPFHPPLPWQSFEGDFPARRNRRRRRPRHQSSSLAVELPPKPETIQADQRTITEDVLGPQPLAKEQVPTAKGEEAVPEPSSLETPPTSHAPSEVMSTQPTTPSSAAPPQQTTPKASTSASFAIPSIPIRPAVPNIPLPSRTTKKTTASVASETAKSVQPPNGENLANATAAAFSSGTGDESTPSATPGEMAPLPKKATPKSWADLVRPKAGPPPATQASAGTETATQTNGVFATKTTSMAEVLSLYDVKDNVETKTAFLEPRGLVNTGNMCYMNSVLQVLVFCVPFYSFLEKVGRLATHTFKSGTPMMDAMIMFMREFSVIDATVSVEQLRMRLRDNELEQYGDAFTPEFVYDVIRRLPRFSTMRRGHQQDAEEFLGFLLEELHDECSRTMKPQVRKPSTGASTPTNGVSSPMSEAGGAQVDDSGWLEVGPKQKAAVTRSSGSTTTESPINKIFGGKLRSELRVPGMKNSVTLEPYQPLQLDIGAAHVSNILDALKGLTRPETLHGDFNSPRGPGSTATKQVTIETLPQVLILHLKRFQYDNAGGTQKIWKKVGYPLDLEIPKEVFPQHKRGGLLAHGGLPKYRLTGVVYHHGKNASGGHYTVDVRRQDGREWIRIDDTVIRRIRSEDVAEGGSEEDPKVLAAALEQHKNDQNVAGKNGNVYEQFKAEEEEEEDTKPGKAWSQVHGAPTGPASGKKWANVANGTATPKVSESGKMTPVGRPMSVKDNKVAYILFYRRI